MAASSVVCIKWGSSFDANYVNRLKNSARRHSLRDIQVVCITDDMRGLDRDILSVPLNEMPFEAEMLAALKRSRKPSGALRKIAMFNPDLRHIFEPGPVLALDLDIIITGPLDPLFDFAPGFVSMPSPFVPDLKYSTLGEGSVIKFEPVQHSFLYSEMRDDPFGSVERCGGSEQSYTSNTSHSRGLFRNFSDDLVVSFKKHCRPRRPFNLILRPSLPKGASIVCFHGKPKVEEAVVGYRAGLFHSTRTAGWLQSNWQ
jgi:hypothetical protein